MRTITIKTGSGTQTYQSNAENLAAKEARLMLDDTSQPLPQGDITLVVSPAKMKAGA